MTDKTKSKIYQYRWFNPRRCDWDEWKITEDLKGVRKSISTGFNYQIRTLEQTSIEGYGIKTQVCDNKIDGLCRLHNIFCKYPDCEK